ncbi:hypothetical protein ACNKHM_22115 [Shigella sonnei]
MRITADAFRCLWRQLCIGGAGRYAPAGGQITRPAPLCNGDPGDLILKLADMRARKWRRSKSDCTKPCATAWW